MVRPAHPILVRTSLFLRTLRTLTLSPGWSRARRSADRVWLADWAFLRDFGGGTTDAQGKRAAAGGPIFETFSVLRLIPGGK